MARNGKLDPTIGRDEGMCRFFSPSPRTHTHALQKSAGQFKVGCFGIALLCAFLMLEVLSRRTKSNPVVRTLLLLLGPFSIKFISIAHWTSRRRKDSNSRGSCKSNSSQGGARGASIVNCSRCRSRSLVFQVPSRQESPFLGSLRHHGRLWH